MYSAGLVLRVFKLWVHHREMWLKSLHTLCTQEEDVSILSFPPNWPQINMYHLMGLSVTQVSLYVFKWKHNSYHVQHALQGFEMGLLFSM